LAATKLLRVLQERLERLGGNKTINVNLRLICATNRNLGEMENKGNFARICITAECGTVAFTAPS
jgi:transcriptional regulator with GAF, ATPase, and Fis domain